MSVHPPRARSVKRLTAPNLIKGAIYRSAPRPATPNVATHPPRLATKLHLLCADDRLSKPFVRMVHALELFPNCCAFRNTGQMRRMDNLHWIDTVARKESVMPPRAPIPGGHQGRLVAKQVGHQVTVVSAIEFGRLREGTPRGGRLSTVSQQLSQ